MYTLAQEARLAWADRRWLEVRLAPEESAILADVLEASLRMMAAVTGELELDLSEPNADELALLAMRGGSFDWLADEPDLYTDADLKERFEWETA
ncbi:MAG: hypothetical protein KKC18_15310 [Chloroflexi bacterium]|nr:hypothetical protein [Chloroflexota bacterium]